MVNITKEYVSVSLLKTSTF